MNDMNTPRLEGSRDEAKETLRDDKLAKPLAFRLLSEVKDRDETNMNNQDEPPSTTKVNVTEGTGNFDLLKSTKLTQPFSFEPTKNIRFSIKRPEENLEFDEMTNKQEIEPLYIERRHCTACNLDQPLRAKHCKDCNRCVAQYDHHCPWLGNCIGEKNHLIFYWYLASQAAEVIWAEIKLFEKILLGSFDTWSYQDSLEAFLLLIITFFFIMVNLLWLFHTYLAMKNLTTWETLSWEKISYLKDWNPEWGSPFSQGVIENLKFFCCTSKTQLKKWKLPDDKMRIDY